MRSFCVSSGFHWYPSLAFQFLKAASSSSATTSEVERLRGVSAVGALANGASATLIVHAKATAVGETTNEATADGKELDLDPANDSDSVKICVDPEPFCPYCMKGTEQKAKS